MTANSRTGSSRRTSPSPTSKPPARIPGWSGAATSPRSRRCCSPGSSAHGVYLLVILSEDAPRYSALTWAQQGSQDVYPLYLAFVENVHLTIASRFAIPQIAQSVGHGYACGVAEQPYSEAIDLSGLWFALHVALRSCCMN